MREGGSGGRRKWGGREGGSGEGETGSGEEERGSGEGELGVKHFQFSLTTRVENAFWAVTITSWDCNSILSYFQHMFNVLYSKILPYYSIILYIISLVITLAIFLGALATCCFIEVACVAASGAR